MFVCAGCQQHAPDSELKYTLLHRGRLNHPNAHFFLLRFHTRDCLVKFLVRLERHAHEYVLTDLTGAAPVEYGPARPRELREQWQKGAPVPHAS